MAFIINPYIFGASGYTVSNSVVLNRASSEYFNRTHDASNRDTWTFSTWFKLGDAGSNEFGLFSGGADMNNCSRLVVDAGRNLKYQHFDSGGTTDHVGTTQVFRDTSAFYHVVLAVDTTQAVEANRIRIYVNGSEVTSFGTSNYPAQNADTDVNTADVHLIGSDEQPNYFSGYLAETVFIDGAQLAASSFGETNEDSGIWVPIDVSGLTFGTNGFHLNYSDSSALGADTSGNSNNFTVNTLVAADQVEDSPNNDADNNIGNYPTWNSILECPHSFADGSLTASVVYNGSTKDWLICTVPVVGGSGIYYWETKPTTISGATDVSLIRSDIPNNLVQISGSNEVYGLRYQNSNKQIRFNNAVIVTATNGYSAGDVIGTLLDSTNGRLYFSINNSWQDGTAGGASSGTVLTEIQDTTNTTYAIPTFVGTVITGNDWFPGADNPHSGTDVVEINFGQKAFAGTMPSNAKRLMTANLPELATTKPTDYFAPVGYTGNATDDRAIAVGFQPMPVLIGIVGLIYAKLYYSRQRLRFHEHHVEAEHGVITKSFYYVRYKNVKRITATRYPGIEQGELKIYVAGEEQAYAQQKKQKGLKPMLKQCSFTSGMLPHPVESSSLLDDILSGRTAPSSEATPAEASETLAESPRSVGNSLVALLLISILLFPLIALLPITIPLTILRVKRWRYRVENFRIVTNHGVLFRSDTSVLLDQVDSLQHSQGILNKIFRNGKVSIMTAGSSKPDLVLIDSPGYRKLHDTIRENTE